MIDRCPKSVSKATEKRGILKLSFADLMLKHQIEAKFVIVGIWNTIFGYGVFCVLDSFFLHLSIARHGAYMSAMVLGQIIAVINAYIFHKYITFKSTARGKQIITEFFRFCMTYVVTFCLSLILLPFFVEVGRIPPKISAAVVILICTIISFLGHSKFSFKDNQ